MDNETPSSLSERLVSLDALRGFDMFWIIGAELLVLGLNDISQSGFTGWLATQFDHVEWEGFRFYDLIFPLFVFLMGVAITLSLDKTIEKEGKGAAVQRIVRRFVLLYILGFIYKGGFSAPFSELQYLGVLQRIAICYLCASLMYIGLSRRGLIGACVLILGVYWALLSFVPVPAEPALTALNPEWGAGGVSFAHGNNWPHYIEYHLGLTRSLDRFWYNEGLISTIPAVATALLGVFAGLWIREREVALQRRVVLLFAAGLVAVLTGYLWGLQFPIIKKLWTSSYVLVAGGYSCILLALFMQLIDVWGYKRWATPFLWIGANALTMYLVARFIDVLAIAEVFVGGDIADWLGVYATLAQTLVAMAMLLFLARFLYKRKIFLRI